MRLGRKRTKKELYEALSERNCMLRFTNFLEKRDGGASMAYLNFWLAARMSRTPLCAHLSRAVPQWPLFIRRCLTNVYQALRRSATVRDHKTGSGVCNNQLKR
jgi:hypothetical protein